MTAKVLQVVLVVLLAACADQPTVVHDDHAEFLRVSAGGGVWYVTLSDGTTCQIATYGLAPPPDYLTDTATQAIAFCRDSEAPKIVVTAPAGGDMVSGTVDIDLTATDNIALLYLEVFVDDTLIARPIFCGCCYSPGVVCTNPPTHFLVAWNTLDSLHGPYPNGSHSIRIRATDFGLYRGSGYSSNVSSATIGVIVSNP